VHKTVNVLDKVPLSVQVTMKKDLREVYWAPNRASAEAAIDVFAEKYRAKYGRAVECLIKDRDALLAFYHSSRLGHGPACLLQQMRGQQRQHGRQAGEASREGWLEHLTSNLRRKRGGSLSRVR
jgi:hypothetical protein